MKKFLLGLLLTSLIICNMVLLVNMQGGLNMPGAFSSNDISSSEADAVSSPNEESSNSVADETSSALSDNAETPVGSSEPQQDNAIEQNRLETHSEYSDKLYTVFEFPENFIDYSSAKAGNKIGNYAANAYNGGYAVLYGKNVYYVDMHSSNYLYFARNNLAQYSKMNKISSMYINVYANKIFYVNQSDGTLWARPVSKNNNKQVGKMRTVCPVAADGYIYYVSPQDEASICGEIRRMNVNDYSDEKISPDGYVCENIIPCGEFVMFISVGKDDRSICVLNTTTSEVTPLYNGNVSDVNICGGTLWFIRHLDSSDEICTVAVGSDEVKAVTSAAQIDNLIVYNGYAYYIVSEPDAYNKCARIAVDGETPEIIYDNQKEVISSFNVTDDFIYFEISDTKKIRRFVPGKTAVTKMP